MPTRNNPPKPHEEVNTQRKERYKTLIGIALLNKAKPDGKSRPLCDVKQATYMYLHVSNVNSRPIFLSPHYHPPQNGGLPPWSSNNSSLTHSKSKSPRYEYVFYTSMVAITTGFKVVRCRLSNKKEPVTGVGRCVQIITIGYFQYSHWTMSQIFCTT